VYAAAYSNAFTVQLYKCTVLCNNKSGGNVRMSCIIHSKIVLVR
jgi:hypothetical protein